MLAAIDLGSNSFRLHIGKYDGAAMRIIKSARDPVRLGGGLDRRGHLTEPSKQAAIASLRRFGAILSAYPLDAARVVATNTLRIAGNVAEFLPEAERAVGYPIEIISGEEEGRLIYLGVACTLGDAEERRLAVDIGGGSTELILGQGQQIEQVESFSIGTVRHSSAFFEGGRIDAASFDAAVWSARSHFQDAAPSYQARIWRNAYGTSGTIRALADAIARNGLGDGGLTRGGLAALKARLIGYGHTSRIELAGMKPDRAPVIVGGLAILIGVMDELGIERMLPLEAGLRLGVLWDLHLRATQRDRREQSVRAFMQRFHVEPLRAERVARSAASLYQQLKPAGDGFLRNLNWSALLHEAGQAVSHTGYHKHGAYLIENADLPGFTAREQRIMSLLVLAHKGNLRKLGNALEESDFAKAVLALRIAVLLMHARAEIEPGEMRLRMKNRIEVELGRDWVAAHPTLAYWIEKEREHWVQAGVEFVLKVQS